MSNINQVAFDVVYRHLIAQGEPSRCRGGSNRYRNEYGLKCAVGALIADEHYHPNLEDYGPGRINVYTAVERSGYAGVSPSLLGRIQRVHDDIAPSEWPVALRRVATTWGLEIPAAE